MPQKQKRAATVAAPSHAAQVEALKVTVCMHATFRRHFVHAALRCPTSGQCG
jgi:hypothetical protein